MRPTRGQLGRRARGQAPFLLVVGLVVAAVVYLAVAPGHWRRGSGVIAVALLLAALLRLALPEPVAGLLAVRSRWLDCACYLVLGVLILTVAVRLG